MRVKIKDVTSSSEYGSLRVGDVVDVDDVHGERWCNSGIAEAAKGAEVHRTVPAPPKFATDNQNYGQVIDRRSLGDYPTNVVPEVQELLAAKDEEIAALKKQLAGPDAYDELGDEHREKLTQAGFADKAAVDKASDDDLARAGLPKQSIGKLRG